MLLLAGVHSVFTVGTCSGHSDECLFFITLVEGRPGRRSDCTASKRTSLNVETFIVTYNPPSSLWQDTSPLHPAVLAPFPLALVHLAVLVLLAQVPILLADGTLEEPLANLTTYGPIVATFE